MEPLDTSFTNDSAAAKTTWRPRENVLIASLAEHSGAVNRLAVSPDQHYFVSVSNDKTARIWPTKSLDRSAFPRSICMYTGHKSKIVDITCIENSHGMATCAEDGSIHVWKVDMVSSNNTGYAYSAAVNGYVPADQEEGAATAQGVANTALPAPSVKYAGGGGNSISGLSVLRTIDTQEQGFVNTLLHFNSDIASILAYSTQKGGGVYGWDIRCAKDAFKYPIRPELGSITAMTMAPDRNWICAGTSEGYVSLWDIRYNVPCKLWRHSSSGPIHRLGSCKSIPRVNVNGIAAASGALTSQQQQLLQGSQPQQVYKEIMPYTEGAYLFVAAGHNESAVWGIPEGGECYRCFRSVPMSSGRTRQLAELPRLIDVPLPRHPLHIIPGTGGLKRQNSAKNGNACEPSVRALLGRISQTGSSYLVTAGTDRHIRFWDFSSPYRCFTVSGLELGQPKSAFESPSADHLHGKLFISYDTALPSSSTLVQAHMPYWENRGPVNPTNKYKVRYRDTCMYGCMYLTLSVCRTRCWT